MTTTKKRNSGSVVRPPVHPGRLLRRELDAAGVSLNALARATRMPVSRVSAIVNGQRSISAETALRLAHYFGTTATYWLNLQMHYDLELVRRQDGAQIAKEVTALALAS